MDASVFQRIADGRTDLVVDWVEAGGIATATDAQGVALVQWCGYYGDVSAIRILLGRGESLAALGENLGLNEAAFHGHWRLVEYLAERGADVNHPLPDTAETPLHAALCKANRPSHDEVVRVLLAYGADPNRATTPGAATGGFMRDVRTCGETPLHRAAAFASEDTVRRLVEAGARLDARDAHGDSPLTWASWHLRPDAILRTLCYDGFSIHPARRSTYDHGAGWEVMGVGRSHPPAR